MSVVLSSIYIYPIKSCRGVAVESATVTPTGLEGDRRFQVVDADGAPVTQRQQTALARVAVTPIDGGLRLECEGHRAVEIATPTRADRQATTLLGVAAPAGDAGDEAATWFTSVIGDAARLVAMIDAAGTALPLPGVDMSIAWADAASVLFANEASQRWLAERASDPFGIDRFRANLIVEGARPWAEDTWRSISIGDARFGYGFAWPRCAIPQVDQLDGSRHGEPAKVLKAHRWCSEAPTVAETLRPMFEGNALFGIGCSVIAAGATVSVGDEVVIDETGDRIIAAPA